MSLKIDGSKLTCVKRLTAAIRVEGCVALKPAGFYGFSPVFVSQ